MMALLTLFWLIFGTLIGQTIILMIGYTILNFLPHNKEFPVLQRLAISYGLGTGFLSLSMFIFILIGLNSRVSFIPIIVITMIFFIYFKIYRILYDNVKQLISLIRNLKLNYIEFFFIILFFIELFLICSYWLIYPIHIGDAVSVWDAEAKYFFYDGNFNYFNIFDRINAPNPDYPLLVPLNLLFFYSIYFQSHYFAKVIFVSFFLFLIIFMYYSLRCFKLNRTYSIAISTLLAMIPDLFLHATIAYADLAMTFFYTISTIFLFLYMTNKKNYYLLYSSIFMGLMAWTKNEGLALLIINSFILILFNIYMLFKKEIVLKKSIINLIGYFVIGFLIYLPWLLFSFFNELGRNEYLPNILDILNFDRTIRDLSVIFKFLIIPQNFYLASFLPFWIIFSFFLILNIKYIFKENTFFLLLLCISHFLLIIFIYIITGYDLIYQLSFSLNRQLLHLTPISAFLIGILLSNNETYSKSFNERPNLKFKMIVYILFTLLIFFIIVDVFFYKTISNLINYFVTFIL